MIDYKTIGSKIRNQRIACNLSQEKLAELCDELNNAELTYKAVSAYCFPSDFRPACGNNRPPHMVVSHLRWLAFVYFHFMDYCCCN